ncbi:MAG TPA: CoA transferase [Rhizomicrobium sp.]|nr:CoA transferase [Rhizomicrobium sp.]
MTARDAFAYLNRIAGIAPLKVPSFTSDDPILPTPFRVAETSAASVGMAASAAHEIWRLRGGGQQEIGVDLKTAASSLVSFALLKRNGHSIPRPAETNPTVGLYQTADQRWIHLHGGFPHLAARTLELLNAENKKEAIAAAVSRWNAQALEDAIAYMKLSGAMVRSEAEWRQTGQGMVLAKAAPIVLKKIGEAPVLRLGEAKQPLEGVRVLDLTRVLAGPTVGRTLASHGAEVLGVRAEKLPTVDVFDLDTGLGKRSTFLDLTKPGDAEQLRALARDAHVFVDSYRPGALGGLGVTPAALSHSSPGIIYCAVSCYGHHGPWASRRGWEQLAQCVTGIAAEQGAFLAQRSGIRREAPPALIPAAVCDYITGYLGAAGVAAALLRRFREGGSWLVEVSLCATAMWLQSLGRVPAADVPRDWSPAEGLDGYGQSCQTELGRLDFLGPVVRMSETPPRWTLPPPELGADKPAWISL